MATCNGDCQGGPIPTLLQNNAELIIQYNVAKLILDGHLRCVRTFMHDSNVPFVLRAYVMIHKEKITQWIYNFSH